MKKIHEYDRDLLLPTNSENTNCRISEKRGNRNYKKTVEVPEIHRKEREQKYSEEEISSNRGFVFERKYG